ncbi:SpoIIE family protein phosphatase [Uliginosibacterium gangwonense]|uniref:SpoIIE family protein phosphatase n=1 Tax=Uliginosibacterium gangwonense TaxID=392736 RepID=UPI00039B0288|nr:SpoIIE family protein phosphatase [Uliginosibacterium gangwonense]
MMNQRTFRVLIADDMQANRALLRAYLGRMGFETLMAEDGEQAIAMFYEHLPDIVLMDLMMPKVDGFEAIRRIRATEMERWVPVVIVSAMDAEYDVVRGLESGADDYLTKPLSYQIFAAKMRNLARSLEFQASRKEAMQREAAVADAMADGVLTFDTAFLVVDANRAAEQAFGRPRNELASFDLRLLLGEQDRAHLEQQFLQYLEGGTEPFIGHQQEVVGLRRSGEDFPMELCVTELPVTDTRLFLATARDISQRKYVESLLADKTSRLQQYHDEAEAEAELAKDIMERHIRRDMLTQSGVRSWVSPTQRFSGDIVLAARSNSNVLYAMLADATGHGLAAALSGLTIVNDFYHAVEQEMPIANMVVDINNALRKLLPVGRFVSAAMLCVDQNTGRGGMWVGGVPDVLQLDVVGSVVQRFSSKQLPLGVVRMELEDAVTEPFELQQNQQLLLCSDGVIEAASADGRVFENEGLEKSLYGHTPEERLFGVMEALTAHLDGIPAHDDISILMVERKP